MWRIVTAFVLIVGQVFLGIVVPVFLALGFFVEGSKVYTPVYRTVNWFSIAVFRPGEGVNAFLLSFVGYLINAFVLTGLAHLGHILFAKYFVSKSSQ